MKSTRMYVGVLMIALLGVAVPASAQMGKDGTGRSGMMGGMGMTGMHGSGMEMGGMGMGEMMKMMRAMSALDLTPDQKKTLQLSVLQHQKEAIPLLGQMRMAGVEIQEMLLADPVNLDKVKTKVREKYDAAAKIEISHLALRQNFMKMLNSKQRQHMESMMLDMRSMMGSMMGAQNQTTEPSTPQGPSDEKDEHGH